MVKLCDLGIAAVRKEEEDNRQSVVLRTVIGTWAYMSPEQVWIYFSVNNYKCNITVKRSIQFTDGRVRSWANSCRDVLGND